MFALVLQGQCKFLLEFSQSPSGSTPSHQFVGYRQDSRLGFPSLDMFIRLTMDNVGWQCNYIANRYAERQICIVKR